MGFSLSRRSLIQDVKCRVRQTSSLGDAKELLVPITNVTCAQWTVWGNLSSDMSSLLLDHHVISVAKTIADTSNFNHVIGSDVLTNINVPHPLLT